MDQEELINTKKELKDKLSDPKALVSDPVAEFEKLAKGLVKNFQIKKGDKQLYWITDIEFYIYTDSHQDIITYPRNCEAGMWFFHASGVDISFASKVRIEPHPTTKKQMPYLDKTAVFGGILIREIVPVDDPKRKIFGPIKVCDELFDQFDAFGELKHFPEIVPAGEEREVKLEKGIVRKGLSTDDEKKVQSILKYNYSGYDEKAFSEAELVKKYKEFREEGFYRFKV